MELILPYLERYLWGLPVLSAIFLIFAVPPISMWGLVFIGLVPIFLFTYFIKSNTQLCLGWLLFSGIHAGFITHSTLSDFHWLAETSLFSFFVKLGGFSIVLMVVGLFVLYARVLGVVKNRATESFIIVLLSISFVGYGVLELFFYWLYSGFNYGALFFAAQNAPYFIRLVDIGGPAFISFGVLLVNIFIWVSILRVLRLVPVRTYTVYVFLMVAMIVLLCILKDDVQKTSAPTQTISIAIVQETGRDPDLTFGYVTEGEFSFPALEKHLEDIMGKDVDFIIYPFAPWSGVMSARIDNSRFDREVITMDENIFSEWLKKYVPPDVVFVTWYTTYREGKYYNQIGYYQNGELLSEYSKENLFPFFDYTPKWALDAGIVSLPYDGTPGVDNAPFIKNDVSIGSLICSEISNEKAIRNSVTGNDVLFSLGSETMFSNQIPGEYNALRAQLSAERYDIPVVRANKFGPSVVFDGNGKVLGRLEYEETGILYVDVDLKDE